MSTDRLDILLGTLDQAEIDEALARHAGIGACREIRFCTIDGNQLRNGPYQSFKKKPFGGFYVFETGNCVDNMREGEILKFGPTGKRLERTHYRRDRKNGPSDRLYEDGVTLRERGRYADDLPEGMFISYHRDGTVHERINYHKGHRQGHYSKTDQRGTIREWGNYRTFHYAAMRKEVQPASVKYQDKKYGLFELSGEGSDIVDRVRYYDATGHEDAKVSSSLHRKLTCARKRDALRANFCWLPFVDGPGTTKECEKKYLDMIAREAASLPEQESAMVQRTPAPSARERLVDFLVEEVAKVAVFELPAKTAQHIKSARAGQIGQRLPVPDTLAVQPGN